MISIPGRIPIYIHPVFWLLIAILGWVNSGTIVGTAIWGVVIFFSVLIHEYGHALTAVFFGQRAEISLVALGGLTRRSGAHLKGWQDFLIVLNGPIAGLLVFFVAYLIRPHVNGEQYPLLAYGLTITVYANLFWTIVNLLPVLPLDGGHLLRIILEGIFGFRGMKAAFMISVILAGLVSLFFFLSNGFLIGALFLMLGFESYRAWADLNKIKPQDNQLHLKELFNAALKDEQEGHVQEALNKFEILREETQLGLLYVESTEHSASLLVQQGHLKQAYDRLVPIENQLSVESQEFLQKIAFQLGEWKAVVRVGQKIYQDKPSAEVALNNALASAQMGNDKPAIGWLRSAIQMGLANVSEVLRRKEFDSIRQLPDFKALVSLH